MSFVVVDVGSTVSDVVSNGSCDSDVWMRGVLGVNEGVLLDDGGDGSDVDSFGERLELDGDGDGVSCGEGSGRRRKGKNRSVRAREPRKEKSRWRK